MVIAVVCCGDGTRELWIVVGRGGAAFVVVKIVVAHYGCGKRKRGQSSLLNHPPGCG